MQWASSLSRHLFFSPTVSQAVGPSGCQRGNKVTGWWARRPLSDHMDWCCARHHSYWLTQQGSSHNRGACSRPGPFILFLSSFLSPHPCPCLFRSFSSAESPFSPICPSLFTLFLCISKCCVVSSCVIQMLRLWEMHTWGPPSLSFSLVL